MYKRQEVSKTTVSTRRHVSKVGPDKSQTGQEIFDTKIDQLDEMHKMMLPAGTDPKETDEMHDCAADAMALPGGYKSSANDEDDDNGDMAKALMTIATGKRETGIHVRYNARNQNGLRQIKGASDLAEFIENVHEGWQHAKETMHS